MRTMNPHRCLLAAVALLATAAVAARADWPNFRGPNYDGICDEAGLKIDWTTPIPLVWERDVGSAFSSFACVGDAVYTCGTANRKQVIYKLNADTGEIIWKKNIGEQVRDPQGGDGPRSTPTVDSERVYILGGLGRLVCYAAEDGKEMWSRQFKNPPTWKYSGSVLIEGDLAIASAGDADGALLAVNKYTGDAVWKCGKEPVGYATPYPFTLDGKRYVVGFTGTSILIVDAKTGEEIYNRPWTTSYKVNAAAPIFSDGYLFLSSGYEHGSILLKLTPRHEHISVEPVWEGQSMRSKFQSPILLDGYLYACDEQGLKCVKFLTGDKVWEERKLDGDGMRHGTIVADEGNLYILSERGRLYIGKASPEGFTPATDGAEILSGRCWTVSVINNGKLYARNLDRVVCFNLRP